MSLTFPRKFAHGQKLGNVDVYGELFLWLLCPTPD